MDTTLKKALPLAPLIQRPRHVHTITDRFSMTNTYLIDDGGLIVVDPGTVLNARLTLHYLQQYLKRTPADIDLIVLTHLHPDHTAGVEVLRQACHAPVAASTIARYILQKRRGVEPDPEDLKNPSTHQLAAQILNQYTRPGMLYHMDLFSPTYERQVEMIDLWLENVAGLPEHPDWRVIVSPGHTPESICIFNPFSHELLCGDTAITVESGAVLVRGNANRRQLEETLNTLRNLHISYLYPGHGRPILSSKALANVHVEY